MTHKDKLRMIEELQKQYPFCTSISYGKNQVGGVTQTANVVVFGVEKKLDSKDINADEVIPSEITFEGNTFQTDVQELNYEYTNVAGFPAGSRRQVNEMMTIVSGSNQNVVVSGVSDAARITDAINEGFVLIALWSGTQGGQTVTFGAHVTAIAASGGNHQLTTSGNFGAIAPGTAVTMNVPQADWATDGGNAPGIPQADLGPNGVMIGGVRVRPADVSANSVGTLGTIAQDIDTNAAVLLTNAHVVAPGDEYIVRTTDTDTTATPIVNTRLYWGQGDSNDNATEILGRVWRYSNSVPGGTNTIDAAVVGLRDGCFNAISHQQLNQTNFNTTFANTSPEWATTAELDALLNTDIDADILFSGQRTGAKGEGQVKLRVIANPTQAAFPNGVTVSNCIGISAFDDQTTEFRDGDSAYGTPCNGLSGSGDSGSAVFGDINGTIKLLGLHFAGNGTNPNPALSNTLGIFCRIDEIASQLRVQRLVDPTAANVTTIVDSTGNISATTQSIVVAGVQTASTMEVGGVTYYREGLTTDAVT